MTIDLKMFSKLFHHKTKIFFAIIFIELCVVLKADIDIKNPIRFPYGSAGPFMGIFLAIAVPLDLPNRNIFLSYNFEANYNIPQNESMYDYPPIISDRSYAINRQNVYDALEFKMNSHGYPGKPCLLRTICEAAESALNSNGVLGDIIFILLAPSSSKNTELPNDYLNAEKYGRYKRHCKKYEKKCSISFLGLISWLDKTI